LQTVVQQLFAELSGQQFQQLVDYFKFKQTTGQLTAARQLLLQLLCAVRIPATGHGTHKEQVQQYSATPCNSIAAAASPADSLQVPQHQQHTARNKTGQVTAASSTVDTSSSRRDQVLSPAGASQQQELSLALPTFYSSTPAANVAASSSSKALAFRQSLSPLQL
jgi:hypothetical protein